MELDELYQSIILDHARRPRNFGELAPPAVRSEGYNPLCGDQITLYVRKGPDGTVDEVRFTGQACAICMASASLMTAQIKGKPVQEALRLEREFSGFLTGPDDPGPALGNLRALAGVKRFPQRLRCATLGWHALVDALKQPTGSETAEPEASSRGTQP
ncbi:MAG: SUF system NifU family Fe-S cluster assembly protein [Verrucomicrobia bacterium]|nr:SUF system NifU family Fe-S cluster assembly protein [Verrucomicrobiota bacterium]